MLGSRTPATQDCQLAKHATAHANFDDSPIKVRDEPGRSCSLRLDRYPLQRLRHWRGVRDKFGILRSLPHHVQNLLSLQYLRMLLHYWRVVNLGGLLLNDGGNHYIRPLLGRPQHPACCLLRLGYWLWLVIHEWIVNDWHVPSCIRYRSMSQLLGCWWGFGGSVSWQDRISDLPYYCRLAWVVIPKRVIIDWLRLLLHCRLLRHDYWLGLGLVVNEWVQLGGV